MLIKVEPVSDSARKVFKEVMGCDNNASLEMARDGEVMFVSQNGQYQTWSALDGQDWKITLPSRL